MSEPLINIEDYIFIDVETTGVNLHDGASYFDDHIRKEDLIQIGMAYYENGKITTVHSYVKPPMEYFDVEDKWYKVNGKPNVSPDLVRDAPAWRDLYSWIRGTVGLRTPVAHNADFDARVLNDTSGLYGLNFIQRPYWKCTKDDAKELRVPTDNHKLLTLAQYFDIPMKRHHDAVSDAITCLKVFESLIPLRTRPDWLFV